MVRMLGGKSKQGRNIATIMSKYCTQNSIYVEPFCGMLGVYRNMALQVKKCYCNDKSPDIILLWKAVKNLDLIEPAMDKDKWLFLKKSMEPSAERALAGYGCSYGGCWFRGYIEGCISQQYKSAMNLQPLLNNTEFYNLDFYPFMEKFRYIVDPTLIYCDIPYENTDCSGYKHVGDFNREKFWELVYKLNDNPNITIFVSEYTDPPKYRQKWPMNNRASTFAKKQDYLYLI